MSERCADLDALTVPRRTPTDRLMTRSSSTTTFSLICSTSTRSRLLKHSGSPAERGVDYHAMLLRRTSPRLNCAQIWTRSQTCRNVLTGLLDKHCPAVKVRHRPKKATPWFDADCRAACRRIRAAERHFRRSRRRADKSEWDKRMKSMKSLYADKRNRYCRNEISINKGNT